ncbi:MAG: penicillin acylase [Ignavibacteriae bacterium]|nr:penicillin acylase [Ignavibacteriota bacterium]
MKSLVLIIFFLTLLYHSQAKACSVVYYIDKITGNIYVANNEDYWYDTEAYIQIIPGSENESARLWYGWDDFAQGGINEHGLFFDGAVTPKQKIPAGYGSPEDNLGDEILAECKTVKEALAYLEKKKIALTDAHIMFGDSEGDAVVVEWINGKKILNRIKDNKLVMTNFLLSDTNSGNFPCYRYNSIEERIRTFENSKDTSSLLTVGNFLGQAAQPPKIIENGKTGGTLYSTFIDITGMEFVLVYKLDNTKVTKIDLKKEFGKNTERHIDLN